MYSRYVLSKISWHFTVSDIGKTWVTEKLDNIASTYIRKWLELPISATLSNLLLPHNKFGLNIILSSTKFVQCQTVSRNALKASPNEEIKNLWSVTSNYKNVQYDTYKSTKDVLRHVRNEHEDKLQHHLSIQGSFFSNIMKYSTISFNSIWSSVQSKLPKNIFNFTIRYINNTLPTRKNLLRWGISPTSECTFCLEPETLLHVVAGCQWRSQTFIFGGAKKFFPDIPMSLRSEIRDSISAFSKLRCFFIRYRISRTRIFMR